MLSRELWYKNAIIYELDIETYMDANGDGIGDFRGLIHKLDYLNSLGVNCLWLNPFYATPNRDNGYDIMDYYSVDERLGNLGDFVEFCHRARELGMRILVDLVVNHTSIQHPWFQEARRNPDSPYYDYYVWSKEKPENADEGIIFKGVQESVWTYDEVADAYYFHRFYKWQPELNIANPAVQAEIKKIMGCWLQLGVSGFRIDAAPYLIELRGIDNPQVDDRYEYLEEFRNFLSWRQGDAIMLAEADVPMDTVKKYFGSGDKMHMIFQFYVNQHIYLALARQQAAPLYQAMQDIPAIPMMGQWAMFLRNHDELDLGALTDEERQDVFDAFGPEENMQIYERGLRRRLAPMLREQAQIELAHSLMFTLPGSPVLYYGDEIGMGENLALEERKAVRTPMQWSDDKNAGFSRADADQLIHPVIDQGEFSYEKVNVQAQLKDRDSLLHHVRQMIQARKETPTFGYGTYVPIETPNPAVYAHRCEDRGEVVAAVHNLSGEATTCQLQLSDYPQEKWIDILGDQKYETIDTQQVELAPYGYRWFRVEPAERR